MYLTNNNSRQKILTSDQEKQLSNKVQDGLKSKTLLEDGSFSSDEEKENLELKVKKGLEARNLFVESNMRLVVSYVSKMSLPDGVSREDLIQEGNIGLITAVEKFDNSLGYKFSTYATFWIKQKILRYLDEKNDLIKIPVHVKTSKDKIKNIREKFLEENGYEISDETLSKISNFNLGKVKKLDNVIKQPVGIDFIVNNFQYDDQDFFDKIRDVLYEKNFYRVIGTLSETEQFVILSNFGLSGESPQSFDKIAKSLGTYPSDIQKIVKKSICKLSHPSRSYLFEK